MARKADLGMAYGAGAMKAERGFSDRDDILTFLIFMMPMKRNHNITLRGIYGKLEWEDREPERAPQGMI